LLALLQRESLATRIESITPCSAGGNNRTFRVVTDTGTLAAKHYFRHAGDERDRLATEFDFLLFAHEAARNRVPRPLACDRAAGLAAYEFVEGSPVTGAEVDLSLVREAASFFCTLNEPRLRGRAAGLPIASEACFSLASHVALVAARLDRLRQSIGSAADEVPAHDLVDRLRGAWARIVSGIESEVAHDRALFDAPLLASYRCVSPSDFGFHNALRTPDGSLRFLDFEYAGWDDPAKVVGDFFSQLAIPVPGEFFEDFLGQVLVPFPDRERLAWRARLLRPVYQMKWCCIALNVFVPVNLARRRFANPDLDEQALKRAQLAKAELLCKSIRTPDHGYH
jgi:hypothetical protein